MRDQLPAPLSRTLNFEERNAIVDAKGRWSYAQLLEGALSVASGLLAGRRDLSEARVVFLVPPGFEYTATLWGIWAAGGIAVPLETMGRLARRWRAGSSHRLSGVEQRAHSGSRGSRVKEILFEAGLYGTVPLSN